MKPRILVFSPFQAIEQHAFPEALFAKSLERDGFAISYLTCDGLLSSFCISHAANGLTENSNEEARKEVCRACVRNRKQIAKSFSSFHILEDFYDRKLEAEIQEIVGAVTIPTIHSTMYENFPVGRIAAYEFILNHKICDVSAITMEQFEFYKISLRNTLRVFFAYRKFLQTNSIDRVILYNQAYSLNNMVREISLRQNISVAFAHAGFNIRYPNDSIYFSWQTTVDNFQSTCNYFVKNYDRMAFDYRQYPMVLDQFREQLYGNAHLNYSALRSRSLGSVCEKLGIHEGFEKVVLLAMSSSDETYAADFSFKDFQLTGRAFKLFNEQVEWIQEVINFFRDKPQYKLIIRIHPREFPNMREGVKAAKIAVYEKIFSHLPDHIVIDWPEMRNSIYDLFEVIDFMLTAQSSVGFDAARLGIPVIGWVDGLGLYPIAWQVNLPKSRELYWEAIKSYLMHTPEPSLHSVAKALEWHIYLFTKAVLQFDSGGFWEGQYSFIKRVKRKSRYILGLPRHSFSKYLKNANNELAARMLSQFMQSNKPLMDFQDYKANLEKGEQKTLLLQYLLELFEIYFGIPVGCAEQVRFQSGKDAFNFSFEKTNDGTLVVELPRKSKVALSLSKFIMDLKKS